MDKLLTRMNEPDPRDLAYLNKERAIMNAVKPIGTGTLHDIPVVHDRLYRLG